MLGACEACGGLNRKQLGLMSFKKLFNVFYQGLSLFSKGKCHIVATKESLRQDTKRRTHEADLIAVKGTGQ